MKIFACFIVVAMASVYSGCGSQSNSNVVTNKINANKIESTPTSATPEPPASVGSLATPSDAYRTAYALREKKDVEGLKKVMHKDVLEFLEIMGEAEEKSLDESIAEIFLKPQAKTAEVRNEKINGDRATVEYLDEEGDWKTMDFVKQGSDWKMALPPKEDLKVESDPPNKKRE